MLCNFATIVAFSLLSKLVFSRGWLPARWDVLGCLRHRTIELSNAKDQTTSDLKEQQMDGVGRKAGDRASLAQFEDEDDRL